MAKGNKTKIILAGLAGLVAGAALGLLLAPEKGSKTRKKLKKKLQEVSGRFQDEFSDEIQNLKTALHLDTEELQEHPEKKKSTKPRS